MFSSTTIASSMTMPVASDSASIVMLLSVKPAIFMNVKVPMIEVGMASAAMKVTRRFLMNRKTTMLASRPPRIRCSLMSSNDRRMKRDWSLPTLIWMSCGSWAWMRCSLSCTRSTTSTVLVPDCLRIWTPIAGVPLSRVRAADFLDAVLDGADVGKRDHRPVGAIGDDDAVEVVDRP